jgi:hypothetical protein
MMEGRNGKGWRSGRGWGRWKKEGNMRYIYIIYILYIYIIDTNILPSIHWMFHDVSSTESRKRVRKDYFTWRFQCDGCGLGRRLNSWWDHHRG